MHTRLRTTGLAGTGAILLVIGMSGAVAAAGLMAASTSPAAPIIDPAPDTSRTWEDIDGNDVDDDCQAVPAVADPTAAAVADGAVDANGDGTISVSEAAHSHRIGGPNCNHGGYVSSVARAQGECAAPETPETSDPGAPADEPPTFTLTAATGDEDDQGDQAEQEDPGATRATRLSRRIRATRVTTPTRAIRAARARKRSMAAPPIAPPRRRPPR